MGKWNKIISFIFVFLVLITATLELYYGVFLFWDSKGFIASHYHKWYLNLDNPFISDIEKRFKCCHFHFIPQFNSHKCNQSQTDACLPTISLIIQEPVEAIGTTFIFHAIIHGLIAFLLQIFVDKKKDKREYDPGEWINERIDNYQEPTYK